MSASERFEVRCTEEIRELADAICDIEGHTTLSTMARFVIIEHARRFVLLNARNGSVAPESRRLAAILRRISEGAS